MYFYSKLKDMRKLKGFTIRELADRSGVSAAYISQLENGNRGIPSPDVLMKLSEGLNSSYSELMEIAGYLESTQGAHTGEVLPSAPVNLRRFIRENELMFDGMVLTDEDKEWVERMLSVLFWKDRQRRNQESDAPAE
ncbi:helix-turn-helix domain-containing protein [Paenibacillus aestuarii]|uniref:Helix-turn-helix domain-containing protein n=1 Tax=Paenibacillus aestuarii TaxID=516965 RepID=A0ABW0KF08_9BACL|nr:helix-turn-helix transcriptional regulator [Paenibacillus aestuarii]